MGLFTQLVALGSVLWVIRTVYRLFLAPNPLDNIPGPTPKSFLTGMKLQEDERRVLMCCFLGDLTRLFHRSAWDFHKKLIHEYGPISVVQGLFGVCETLYSQNDSFDSQYVNNHRTKWFMYLIRRRYIILLSRISMFTKRLL